MPGSTLPVLSARRGFDLALGLSVLQNIGRIVEPMDRSLHENLQDLARGRILSRDTDD